MRRLTELEKKALALFEVDIHLFGSKARGDAAKHSDIDLLVVLADGQPTDRRTISHLGAEVLFETGVVLSTTTFSSNQVEQMRRRRAMFWQTIEPDLISL